MWPPSFKVQGKDCRHCYWVINLLTDIGIKDELNEAWSLQGLFNANYLTNAKIITTFSES